MVYIRCDKLWKSEFYNLSAKDRVQDINLNQIKLRANDNYKEDKILTANFEPSNDEDVVIKAHMVAQISKVESHAPI